MTIGKDKYMHFLASAIITLITSVFFYLVGKDIIIAALAGALISTAAGWGKEYGDKVNPNNKWDWCDIIADTLGTLFGLLWLLLL